MSVLTQRSPSSHGSHHLPNSFNASYGADVGTTLATSPGPNDQTRVPVPSSVDSTANEHLHLSQEVTHQGDTASSITLSGQYQDASARNDPQPEVEDGIQFNMDEDSADDEVKSKTPPLYGVSVPVPDTRQSRSSTTDTDSTITSTSTDNCLSPLQEENPGVFIYYKSASIEFYRKILCQGICRFEDAPHLEKTIFIKMDRQKVEVDLQFMAHCSRGKAITLQAYFKLPSSKKSRLRVRNIINGYRECSARLVASVRNPQTQVVVAENKSKPVPIGPDASIVYAEIENLVEHDCIIYAKTKYMVFEVKAEIVCRGKITARNETFEGSGDVVVVT